MDVNSIFEYFTHYGVIFIFIIVFLEYLNMPGLAAAIVMPAVGVWCSQSGINLVFAILISVFAGVAASWILYFIGLFFGDMVMNKYLPKHPKQKAFIEKKVEYVRQKGHYGVFVSRFIPAVRTIISIPAGLVRLDFIRFTACSAVAILIYNSAFISAGYFMGTGVFKALGAI